MVTFPTASESYQYAHGLFNIEVWLHQLDPDFGDGDRTGKILADMVAFASKPDPEGPVSDHA